ncbi:MAG: copper chaperone PCu(A)C [Wenzhouxiangellaceae bacterium]|nr:copper chaperone PCu(A)C [Wenzhouxiangellaceae bacterium]
MSDLGNSYRLRSSIRAASATLVVLLLTGCGHDGPRVEEAWIRDAPPSAPMRAIYFVLVNDGPATLRVAGARVEGMGRAEIHRTVRDGGMSRMRPAGMLEIAPGDRLRLEPGGLHLMAAAGGDPPRPGDRRFIEVLDPEGGVIASAEAEVRR